MCYIDDIVVHSKTWEEHVRQVRAVLERLKQFGLTANPKKCVWGVAVIDYLGHTVGRGKVRIPEVRVKALKEFRKPVTKKELKSYLGISGITDGLFQGSPPSPYPLPESLHLSPPAN